MSTPIPSLENLIDHFAALPGIGRKTASRLAYYVLAMPEVEAKGFAESIVMAHSMVHQCPICHNLTDTEQCGICKNEDRDNSVICVVESPQDVNAFEKTREYKGLYHVLHGLISPIDGITPEQIHIKDLIIRAADDVVEEVIMATNPTVEGESTAIYISKLIKPLGVKVTRLAYGMPVGGNLEHADEVTLYRALTGRSEI
ncbi:MAG: recombination mediator RecR [Oscillospiraceae bacterium]|nr:recombination mediator RecR [Oscillospiraceae bacterium]